MDDLLVVTAKHAVLPDDSDTQSATIEISLSTGKITRVHTSTRSPKDYSSLPAQRFLELEEGQILLPGLVDAVCKPSPIRVYSTLTVSSRYNSMVCRYPDAISFAFLTP